MLHPGGRIESHTARVHPSGEGRSPSLKTNPNFVLQHKFLFCAHTPPQRKTKQNTDDSTFSATQQSLRERIYWRVDSIFKARAIVLPEAVFSAGFVSSISEAISVIHSGNLPGLRCCDSLAAAGRRRMREVSSWAPTLVVSQSVGHWPRPTSTPSLQCCWLRPAPPTCDLDPPLTLFDPGYTPPSLPSGARSTPSHV